MPDPIPQNMIDGLAAKTAAACVVPGGRFLSTTCRAVTGKARSRHWAALCAAGYVTPDPDDKSRGTVTPRAFAEVAETAAVDLAAKYTWDRFDGDRRVWVVWDSLTDVERVAAAARHRRDPAAVEFMVVLDASDKWERFHPEKGEGPGDAYVRLGKDRGYWRGTLCVRDAAVVAKAEAARRAAYREHVMRVALNPYLVSTGVFTKDEPGVAVSDGTPSFFSTTPYLPNDPAAWTDASIEAFVARCRDRVERAAAAYDAASRFWDAVGAAGGADKFREKYLAEVDAHVATHYKPEGPNAQ